MQNDFVLGLFQKNNGIMSAEKARNLGIDNKVLQRLVQSGHIERLERGLYLDVNYMEDEYMVVQYRCPKAIFSHETALYFHELCDRTPFRLMMTIPSGYSSRLIKEIKQYKFFYCINSLYEIGVSELKTIYGNKVRVYDKERTICACIRKKDKMDSDIVVEALKRYMKTKGADYAKLLEYAEIFKIRDKIKQYMEVLI